MKEENLFSIRQVIELTGVTEFTIRGWENRYLAITPSRTQKGRRLYSSDDVLKIKALKDLVDSGIQISTIAHYSFQDLTELIATHSSNQPANDIPKEVSQILELAEKYQWDKISLIFNKERSSKDTESFILNFILPLIREINILVMMNTFSVAKEHILSAMMKEELYSLRHRLSTNKSHSRIIFTTPEKELHELGILISSTLSTLHGVTNLYLGPNTPKQQIAEVCLKYKATHLVLSATETLSPENLLIIINFLDKQLPDSIVFCFGGSGLSTLPIALKRKHYLFTTLDDVNEFFKNLT